MGESRLQRDQRKINEDHDFRRKVSQRTVKVIDSTARIDELTAAIDRRRSRARSAGESSVEFRQLAVEWMLKKTSTLTAIAGRDDLPDELKSEWRAALEAVTVTDSDEAALDSLLARVRASAGPRFLGRPLPLSGFVPPGGPDDIAGRVAELIDIHARARAAFST